MSNSIQPRQSIGNDASVNRLFTKWLAMHPEKKYDGDIEKDFIAFRAGVKSALKLLSEELLLNGQPSFLRKIPKKAEF